MGAITHPQALPGARVQLAIEPTLQVGALSVDPSTRQVSNGDRHETLEPRVMQVLIALGRAPGRVVSRDELIDCCWDARVVGEDAIHRVLLRLRHVAAGIGEGSFSIDTIRRVGYRLNEIPHSPGSLGNHRPMQLSRRAILGSATVAAATVAAGIWVFPRRQYKPLPLALQYYQRGMETRGQASLELAEQGTALFREATRIDPDFADAWGALAWNYRGLLEFGQRPDAERLRALCQSAAAHALKLDPDNAEAKVALLLLKPFYGNWAEIERGCRDLLGRHPHHSIIQYNLAYDLNQVGRWRESIPFLRDVANREPFWPLAHLRLVFAVYESGNIEESDDMIDDGMKRFPRRKDYWVWRMRHLIIAGRLTEAIAFANDVNSRPAVGIEPAVDFEIGIAHALADGSEAARRHAIVPLLATARAHPDYLPTAAVSACVMRDVDLCVTMLEGYYFGRGPWAAAHSARPATDLLFGSSMAALRAHPRFPALLNQTGLTRYWQTTGTLPDYRRFA